MNLELLFDPLFRLPFATGLLLAVLLPVLGLYLRLRQEWLAALGLAHIAGAGAVIAAPLGLPLLPAAIAATFVAALVKARLVRYGNEAYGLFILLGWALMILGAAFSHHGRTVGQTLVDGQLYFTGVDHLITALGFALLMVAFLPWVSGYLLRERLFPRQDAANQRPVRAAVTLFDLIIAAGIAIAATAIGVMGAFALLFIPPWIAFGIAGNWRRALIWSAILGLLAYLVGYVAAIGLDLPFGPILVLALLLMLPSRWLVAGRPTAEVPEGDRARSSLPNRSEAG